MKDKIENKLKLLWCVRKENDNCYLYGVKSNGSNTLRKMYDHKIESVRSNSEDLKKEANSLKFELHNGLIVILAWSKYTPLDGCFPLEQPDNMRLFISLISCACNPKEQQSIGQFFSSRNPSIRESSDSANVSNLSTNVAPIASSTPSSSNEPRRLSIGASSTTKLIRMRSDSTSTSSDSEADTEGVVGRVSKHRSIEPPAAKCHKFDLIGSVDVLSKSHSEQSSSNAAFLAKLKKENYVNIFEVPLDDLRDPGQYGIRSADPIHVRKLEDELLENPLIELLSPIVVMVDPEYGDINDFSIETLRCYRFLVLSGNHRRQALINLRNDETRRKLLPSGFELVKIHVYKNLSVEEARRLGLLMQSSSELVSPLSFADKAKLCRSLLISETNKRLKLGSQETMETFGHQKQLQQGVKPMVLDALKSYLEKGNANYYIGVSSLPYSCFTRIIDICNLHRQFKLKNMKPKPKKAPEDPKPYHFSFVRDLLEDELVTLLQAIIDKNLSLENAGQRAKEIKALHHIQKRFCIETDTKSWAAAKEKFPIYATEDQLKRFIGMPHPCSAFSSFCQRAIASCFPTVQEPKEDHCLTFDGRQLFFVNDLSNLESFTGAHLFIITITTENEEQLKAMLRRFKSSNLQRQFKDYTIALVYPIELEPMIISSIDVINPTAQETPITIIQKSIQAGKSNCKT